MKNLSLKVQNQSNWRNINSSATSLHVSSPAASLIGTLTDLVLQSIKLIMKRGYFLIIFFVLVSCSKQPVSKHSVKVTQKTPVVVSKKLPVITAERTAAKNLVNEGKNAIVEQQHDKATDLFQEAISVDPSCGEAFLELAKLKFQSGQTEEAKSLLDKATYLLKDDPDWTQLWQPQIEALGGY